jgi:hypothetical protein
LLADNAARQALQADSAVRTEHLREAVAETASSLDGWNTEGVSEETPETRWYR